MCSHVGQLRMQCALRRIVFNTLHAVLLKTVDIDQQFGDMVRALAIQTRHHVRDMRQLLWVEGANTHLVIGFDRLGCIDAQVGTNFLRRSRCFDRLNSMR